jgi:hypothetical protein
MPGNVPEELSRIIEAIYRSESGRILATLVRLLGDLDVAEEAMHEAFAAALDDWGAGVSGSPIFAGPYWFLAPKNRPQAKGLPPILVFAVAVANWSDGTVAPVHQG